MSGFSFHRKLSHKDLITGEKVGADKIGASLLLADGVSMKEIQEGIGHSDFSTTANIYAHLDYSSKLSSANAMSKCLDISSLHI